MAPKDTPSFRLFFRSVRAVLTFKRALRMGRPRSLNLRGSHTDDERTEQVHNRGGRRCEKLSQDLAQANRIVQGALDADHLPDKMIRMNQ
eukprot:COSAG04_NODE_18028_length_453_cov_0.612994_1_plen_90_part_00